MLPLVKFTLTFQWLVQSVQNKELSHNRPVLKCELEIPTQWQSYMTECYSTVNNRLLNTKWQLSASARGFKNACCAGSAARDRNGFHPSSPIKRYSGVFAHCWLVDLRLGRDPFVLSARQRSDSSVLLWAADETEEALTWSWTFPPQVGCFCMSVYTCDCINGIRVYVSLALVHSLWFPKILVHPQVAMLLGPLLMTK